jgi:hypothetical protein
MAINSGEIHQYDIGTKFLATVKDQDRVVVPIQTATVISFTFTKPSGETVVRSGTLETDGSDGKYRYITTQDDLDEAGKWSVQGLVTLPSGSWNTNIITFTVKTNLAGVLRLTPSIRTAKATTSNPTVVIL